MMAALVGSPLVSPENAGRLPDPRALNWLGPKPQKLGREMPKNREMKEGPTTLLVIKDGKGAIWGTHNVYENKAYILCKPRSL